VVVRREREKEYEYTGWVKKKARARKYLRMLVVGFGLKCLKFA